MKRMLSLFMALSLLATPALSATKPCPCDSTKKVVAVHHTTLTRTVVTKEVVPSAKQQTLAGVSTRISVPCETSKPFWKKALPYVAAAGVGVGIGYLVAKENRKTYNTTYISSTTVNPPANCPKPKPISKKKHCP